MMDTIMLNDLLSDSFAHVMVRFRETSLLLQKEAKLRQPIELQNPTYALKDAKEIGSTQIINTTEKWSKQIESKRQKCSTEDRQGFNDLTEVSSQRQPSNFEKRLRPLCLSNVQECQEILDRLNHFKYHSTDAFFHDLEQLFGAVSLKKVEKHQLMRFFDSLQTYRQESAYSDSEKPDQLAAVQDCQTLAPEMTDSKGSGIKMIQKVGWKQEQAQRVFDLEILRDAEAYCSIHTLKHESENPWLNTTVSDKDTPKRYSAKEEGKSARSPEKSHCDRLMILRLRRLIQLHVCPHMKGQEVCVISNPNVLRDPSQRDSISWTATGRIQDGQIYSYTSKKIVKFADFVLEQLQRQSVACQYIYLSQLQQSIDQHLAICDYIPTKIRSDLSINFKLSAEEYLAYADANEHKAENCYGQTVN
uniref:Uncharacterized protein AlNc14C1G200 n=1 Tax=Albugo laibachii Nc14 TaxID=890382 RepID=F0VZ59_9STRA|nr:conserved hypothetical protein [Albugo laibachii Nc14]|eukprot:CCA14074.1 conserved hypothetical protein [Albugo laibachii Nc14]